MSRSIAALALVASAFGCAGPHSAARLAGPTASTAPDPSAHVFVARVWTVDRIDAAGLAPFLDGEPTGNRIVSGATGDRRGGYVAWVTHPGAEPVAVVARAFVQSLGYPGARVRDLSPGWGLRPSGEIGGLLGRRPTDGPAVGLSRR